MKKDLCMLAVALISAALAPPAYSQTASSSAALAQADTVELHVAAFVVPLFVIVATRSVDETLLREGAQDLAAIGYDIR